LCSYVNSFLLLARLALKLEKIMNEMKSKRRIQIIVLQKQEIEEKARKKIINKTSYFL
jgi:hypothetical protein